MIEFYIKKDSLNPVLGLDLIFDGRNDFRNFYESVQDANVTFTMINSETNIPKILNAEANIELINDESCEEKYAITYHWKKNDTNKCGQYKGYFNIVFNGNITQSGVTYPNGNLIMPIREELKIYIM